MTAKELLRLICALAFGAMLAFPAGLLVSRLGDAPPAAPTARHPGAVRDVFSPAMRSDPWFIDRQRANAAALESECRRTGQYCAEASEARRLVEELAGG